MCPKGQAALRSPETSSSPSSARLDQFHKSTTRKTRVQLPLLAIKDVEQMVSLAVFLTIPNKNMPATFTAKNDSCKRLDHDPRSPLSTILGVSREERHADVDRRHGLLRSTLVARVTHNDCKTERQWERGSNTSDTSGCSVPIEEMGHQRSHSVSSCCRIDGHAQSVQCVIG